MKLLDVNLLIYAVDETSARFPVAHPWVQEVLGGRETVALPWVVLLAFVRLTTSPRIMTFALSADAALDLVDGWLGRPNTVIVGTDTASRRGAARVARRDRHRWQPRDGCAPGGACDQARRRAQLA